LVTRTGNQANRIVPGITALVHNRHLLHLRILPENSGHSAARQPIGPLENFGELFAERL
jgi:hypothetical protein